MVGRLPQFVPRKGGSKNGLVHDDKLIKRVFSGIDTATAAAKLMQDRGVAKDEPHFVPRTRNSNRRNITVTLCGDPRGATTLHRIAIGGNDAAGAAVLRKMGLTVRPLKRIPTSWRFETSFKDYGKLMRLATEIRRHSTKTCRTHMPSGDRFICHLLQMIFNHEFSPPH